MSGVDTGGGASGRGAVEAEVEVYVISACMGWEVKGCVYC